MIQKRYKNLINDYQAGCYTKKGFLDALNNDFFGGSGLLVQIHEKDGIVTKWREWLDVRDNDWWVDKCNHRLIASFEFVFDFDGDTREECLEIVNNALSKESLKALNPLVFDTGKGFHAHVWSIEAGKRKQELQKRGKSLGGLFSAFSADSMKGSKRTMIALELQKHWKREKNKKVWDYERARRME